MHLYEISPSILYLQFPTPLWDTWEEQQEISHAALAALPLSTGRLWPIFLFLFFLHLLSGVSIYLDQCKKGQNSHLAPLELLQLVLKLVLFQHKFLLLCTWETTGCQCVCVWMWSNTTSRACLPPDFKLKMALSFSYLHVPPSRLKCCY